MWAKRIPIPAPAAALALCLAASDIPRPGPWPGSPLAPPGAGPWVARGAGVNALTPCAHPIEARVGETFPQARPSGPADMPPAPVVIALAPA
jgi:hypothetical protein